MRSPSFTLILHIFTYVTVVPKQKLHEFKSRVITLFLNVMVICIFTFIASNQDIYQDRLEIFCFLSLHPMAMFHWMEKIYNIKDMQPTLMAPRMHTDVLRKEAGPYEHVSYRFIPTSKDVGYLVHRMQKNNICIMMTG